MISLTLIRSVASTSRSLVLFIVAVQSGGGLQPTTHIELALDGAGAGPGAARACAHAQCSQCTRRGRVLGSLGRARCGHSVGAREPRDWRESWQRAWPPAPRRVWGDPMTECSARRNCTGLHLSLMRSRCDERKPRAAFAFKEQGRVALQFCNQ